MLSRANFENINWLYYLPVLNLVFKLSVMSLQFFWDVTAIFSVFLEHCLVLSELVFSSPSLRESLQSRLYCLS